MTSRTTRLAITASAMAFAIGCASEDTTEADFEPNEIANAIELENGGYEEVDELPMFGMDNLEELADTAKEAATNDPMEADATVAGMLKAPDAVLYHTGAIWGQFPGNLDVRAPWNWTGRITVSRGAIVVRGTVGFESLTDALLPRVDRKTVQFRSLTGPHRDGLRMTIVDPDPGNAEPLYISYGYRDGDEPVLAIPIQAAVHEPWGTVVNDRNDRFVFSAVPQPVDVCQYGFIKGAWKQVQPQHSGQPEEFGFMLGTIHGPAGGHRGYLKGIFGIRMNGSQVLFAKAISLTGETRGILVGRYKDGLFGGRWLSKAGEFGAFAGRYFDGPNIAQVGFLGRWAERSCDIAMGGPNTPGDPNGSGTPDGTDPNQGSNDGAGSNDSTGTNGG